MAKVFVTGFLPNRRGVMTVVGFLDNPETGVYAAFYADTVPYDLEAGPLKTQIHQNMPEHINAWLRGNGLEDEANIIAADIEIIT